MKISLIFLFMPFMTKKDKKTCSACGTSPINHKLLFITNLIEEITNKLDFIFPNFNRKQTIANIVEKYLLFFLSKIRIARFSADIEKTTNGRSRLIWEEAKERNIQMEQVVVLGKYIDHYKIKINNKIYFFESIPTPPNIPQKGYLWADNKFKLFTILNKNKIKVPKTKKIFSFKKANKIFEEFEKPVIIKPAIGSRSRHTTTNINTKEQLKKAYLLAKQITPFMVIQEHLSGFVCRATVIDNKLVGFYIAHLPQIVGDGKNTIKNLILEQNKNKKDRVSDIEINEELINFIERQGYNLEKILENEKILTLGNKTGRNYGGYTKEMLGEVHPKMHEIFSKVSKIIEAPVLGFDLIIQDPTKDPDNQKWGIIECNTLPFIDLHYFALEGKPINLAKNVWDLWNIKN